MLKPFLVAALSLVLAGATNARGARTSFAYSRYDELAGIVYPNTATTPKVSFTYDLLGRKQSMTDGIGTSGWSYDGVGRLQGESGPFGNDTLAYNYDSLNRVQSLSIGRDATTSDGESFGYDTLGRLASVSASAGAFGNVGTFGYSYVGNTSLLAQMTRPNGTKTVLSYENAGTTNALHRLTGVQDVSATGGNIASFGYAYDASSTNNGFVDNRTSQTRSYGSEGAQKVAYGYNPTSMLQGEGGTQGGASTPALSKSYVFDAMGNRTSATDAVAKTQTTSTYNSLNQLTGQSFYSTSTGAAVGTGSSAFGYDGDGNMNSVTAKDASGNVTGQTSYSYDDAARLIGITTPGGGKWQFVYDGLSRLRVSRSWKWVNGAWVQDSEKRRVYLAMNVVQERDASNNVIASYTRTGNIGGLLARSTSSGNVFYGYDGGGNVTTLTDTTGAVVGSYTYDAWGNTLASSGTKAQENPYRFSTKEQIAGYYSYGFRFYNSGLGRWINRDPIEEDGGANLYEAMDNSLVDRIDLYGENGMAIEMPVYALPTFGAIGAGIGEGLGAIGTITAPAWALPVGAGAAVAVGVGYPAYKLGGEPLSKWLYPDEMELPAPGGSVAIPKGPTFCPAKKSKSSDKARATDIPTFARNYRRGPGQSCHDFAIMVLLAEGRPLNTGPGSEYSKIKKNCERGGS